MNYIRITEETIDKEHICCAMSGKQSHAKKEWLKQRFAEGLVFYRSEERGKCFIEYIPAENAWVPIEAAGYLYINCLWVSGSMKGHGYSNDLLNECIRDANAQGKKGLCILCAQGPQAGVSCRPEVPCPQGLSSVRHFGLRHYTAVPATDSGRRSAKIQGLRQASQVGRNRLCPLLHRPMSLYLLLGTESGGNRKGTPDPIENHPYYDEGRCTECARPGHHLCPLPGRERL